MKRVLVLCHGNLNRSPAAEKILRRHRPGLEVQSAGVGAKDGSVIAKKMRDALEQCGYDSAGKSRRVTRVMTDWADLILVMDEKNASRLMDAVSGWCESPEEIGVVQRKIRYVGDLIGMKKVPDPHFSTGTAAHHDVIRWLEQAFATPTFDRWLEE